MSYSDLFAYISKYDTTAIIFVNWDECLVHCVASDTAFVCLYISCSNCIYFILQRLSFVSDSYRNSSHLG